MLHLTKAPNRAQFLRVAPLLLVLLSTPAAYSDGSLPTGTRREQSEKSAASARFTRVAIVERHCDKCDRGFQDWDVYPHGDVRVDHPVIVSNRNAPGSSAAASDLLTSGGQARLPAIGPDRATIGWVTGAHGRAEHGETVLLSTDLVLWRNGEVVRIHRDGFIHRWTFCNKGLHVFLETGPVRDVRYYSLYEAATGKLLWAVPSYGTKPDSRRIECVEDHSI